MYMMKRTKRLVAVLLAGIMIIGSGVPAYADNNQISNNSLPNMVAHYPLVEDVKDVSGNGNDAQAFGNVTYAEGLTLPGGRDSSTNHVKLPDGMFDGRDNVSISVWLKSNTEAGDYSALFFGSEPQQSNSMPANYWLFNPLNRQGNFKSVITNLLDPNAPYGTEVGVTGAATAYKNVWTHYVTVVSGSAITAYVNGEKVGSTAKERQISDFGSNLNAYIGRSNYALDPTYAGSFQELRIYDGALDETGVKEDFMDASIAKKINDDMIALSLGDLTSVGGDISLPTSGNNGTQITWDSSQPGVISNTGKVTLGDSGTDVTLTASFTLDGKISTKKYEAYVIAGSMVLDIAVSNLRVPYILTKEDKLPLNAGVVTIEWSSDKTDRISTDGIITGGGIVEEVALAATLTYNGKSETKNFHVKVLPAGDINYITSYTRQPGDIELTNNLHLGYSKDGVSYQALNNNTGIVFPKADLTEGAIYGTTKLLERPYLFRMEDGTFGAVAKRTNVNGPDLKSKSSVLLFTSKDLINFEEKGLISLNTDKTVTDPICEYDSNLQTYCMEWKDEDGNSWYNKTSDFQTISNPIAGERFNKSKIEIGIEGALAVNQISVTSLEGEIVSKKFLPVTNTGINSFNKQLNIGETITMNDLGDAQLTYSDDSTAQKPIVWDQDSFDAINFNEEGIYEVNGTLKQTKYAFPMMAGKADPNVLKFNDKYYFIATDENGWKRLYIREADSIKGLSTAAESLIYTGTNSGDMSGCIWAPELHEINGELYILFAGGTSGTWNTVQARVMKLTTGGDPSKASDWGSPMRVVKKDGSNLFENGITLDMTYFENGGVHYVVWSQRVIGNPNGSADLFIASMNPDEPWKLTSDPVLICTPEYGWDRNTAEVNEGPFIMKHDGKIYLTYSGSNIDDTYCVGLLTADENTSNLLSMNGWKKTGYPIWTSDSIKGQYGPGHNSYTVDEDGNYVNIFHAKAVEGAIRDTGARRVHWAADGSPVLTMTDDLEIAKENQQVSAFITVTNQGTDQTDLELKSALDQITIPDANQLKGNITLSDIGKFDTTLSWSSSDTAVITAAKTTNAGYAPTPAGVVTRQSVDKNVTLTVTASKNGKDRSKQISVTVKAKDTSNQKYTGYLYAYFSGDESRLDDQQIYFAVSKDGNTFSDLNENNPVLTSNLGDKSLRDPYIIRSADGSKFYLIATDLDIRDPKYGGDWGKMATKGSQSLMIWESTDLVNWSKQRMVKVSDQIDAGNTWAPEAIYDEVTGEYLVYWSSRVASDNYAKHKIYVAKTRDFYTFTKPEVYSDEPNGNIDASIFKDGNQYYRLIKDDTLNYVKLESANKLLNYDSDNRGSHFTHIQNEELESFKGGYEGATMFKFNDEPSKWCVLVDEYTNSRRGYIPFVSEDISGKNSLKLKEDGTYLMPTGAKHGTVIPITEEEYTKLCDKWKVKSTDTVEKKDPVLTYNFDETLTDNKAKDVSGNGNDAKLYGNAKYITDNVKGQVLYLDGTNNTYAEIPKGFFDGRDQVSISMDIKPQMGNGNFFTFAIGQGTNKYMFLRTRDNGIRNAITTQSNGKERAVSTAGVFSNEWINVKIIMADNQMSLYVDNELAASNDYVHSISDLGSGLLTYIGKAFFDDPYFKGCFDNIQVYNRALTKEEIVGDEEDKPTQDLNKDKLIANFEFADDISTKIITDSSGKNNHGSLKGNGAAIKDGILTLPGGAANSGAGYVEMKKGMFDNKDNITISAWLKNDTGKGNYAAMFFGTPSQYWLLNPSNTAGQFKSVITNEKNTSTPFKTEYGISPSVFGQGIDGPITDANFGLYTTVIQPNSITGYYNGRKIGTVKTKVKVSDFGNDLLGYIGKSTYSDMFYKGSVKQVKVYETALNDNDVIEEYYRTSGSQAGVLSLLEKDKVELTLKENMVIHDLQLPLIGKNGSKITWTSSDTSVIADDGAVTRPNSQDETITMKAVLSIANKKVEKEFKITVLENSDEKTLKYVAEHFDFMMKQVFEDLNLPTTAGENTSITWISNHQAITNDGKVTRPDENPQKVTLTAKISLNGVTVDKQFEVTVLEKVYGNLLTYVTDGNNDRTDTLHYAYSKDGNEYTALNNNQGILYTAKGSRQLGAPYLFRKAEGGYGLIASDNNSSSNVFLYSSTDLITFTKEEYVSVNKEGIVVQNPTCIFDSSIGGYRINFKDHNGNGYAVTTKDFAEFTSPVSKEYNKEEVSGILPNGAAEASVFEVTKSEYEGVIRKFDRIVNTGLKEIEDVTVGADDTLTLPKKVTLTYSDGSTKDMGAVWNENDIKKIDRSKPGTYTVKGSINQPVYSNPLIAERADPYVIYNEADGYYYFTGSYPTYNNNEDNQGIGYDRLILRRSKTIEGLKNAEEVVIWNEHDDPVYNRYIWAPELHKIGDSWYIMTTTTKDGNKWGIIPTLLRCTDGTDLMNPDNWEMVGWMKTMEGDNAFSTFSLDMTYFESNGVSYMVWPEKKMGNSDLYIATVDPENPVQLTSKAIRLSVPELGWEHDGGTWVDEGPAVIKNNGMVYLCFSAAAVNDTYCVGMLTAKEGADLIDVNNWTKNAYPLLTSADFDNKEYGPGHNSFTVDENGNPVIVYHARQPKDEWVSDGGLNDPGRHARVKSVNFAADGSPVLNMTREEEVAEEFKAIEVTVVVTEGSVDPNPDPNPNPDPGPGPSGGSSNTVVESPVIKVDSGKENSVTAITEVTGKVDASGVLRGKVSKEQIGAAIEEATKEAKAQNKDNIIIEIKLNQGLESGKTISGQKFTLSKEICKALSESKVSQVKIISSQMEYVLDKKAMEAIYSQAGTDVTLTSKSVSNVLKNVEKSQQAKAKTIFGKRKGINLTITYEKNGNTHYVSDFKSGKITLSLPYILGKGEKASNVHMYYVGKNGTISRLPSSYDSKAKKLYFTTGHFSNFIIGYDKTVAKTAIGSKNLYTSGTKKTTTIKTVLPFGTKVTKAVYKSSKPSCVKVSSNGSVSAKKVGSAKITVRLTFNDMSTISSSYTVTVKNLK